MGNNLCRNPDSSATMDGSIWCYTTDPSTPKEKCLPMGYCENTLNSNGVTSKTVKYNDPPFVLSAKNDLFANSKESKCPIKTCKLMTADCSAVYTATDLRISITGDLDVSLLTTKVAGG